MQQTDSIDPKPGFRGLGLALELGLGRGLGTPGLGDEHCQVRADHRYTAANEVRQGTSVQSQSQEESRRHSQITNDKTIKHTHTRAHAAHTHTHTHPLSLSLSQDGRVQFHYLRRRCIFRLPLVPLQRAPREPLDSRLSLSGWRGVCRHRGTQEDSVALSGSRVEWLWQLQWLQLVASVGSGVPTFVQPQFPN
jgi:hypothetical protein